MISKKDKLGLGAALLALFGTGLATGYFWGLRQTSEPVQVSPRDSANAGDWWKRSRDRLVADLELNAAQQAAVEPLLQRSADQVFLNRDRALFQIHLELLSFHTDLARQPSLLDARQQQRVEAMQEKLRRQIQAQFPQFLKDHPLPVMAQLAP